MDSGITTGSLAVGESRGEWSRGWPALLSGLAGMILSGINVYSMGLFMQPLSNAFGWSRGEISSSLLVAAVVSIAAYPIAGRLVERYGMRAITLPGLLLTGAAFAALGLSNGSLLRWWFTWALVTCVYAAANPTIWVMSVSRAFVANRGLAIGIAMCGAGLASIVIPQVVRFSIDWLGWRLAFGVVGAFLTLIPFCLVLFSERNELDSVPGTTSRNLAENIPGLDLSMALRTRTVLQLFAVSVLSMTIIVTCIVHAVPLLMEEGLGRAGATNLLGVFGIAAMLGKLASGWLMDRFPNRIVPAISYALPAVACLLFLRMHGNPLIACAALTALGLGSGAVLQLSADILIRYTGLRAFAQIHGLLSGAFAVGSGIGPLVAGMIYDVERSYANLLIGAMPLALLAGLLIFLLGEIPKAYSIAPKAC